MSLADISTSESLGILSFLTLTVELTLSQLTGPGFTASNESFSNFTGDTVTLVFLNKGVRVGAKRCAVAEEIAGKTWREMRVEPTERVSFANCLIFVIRSKGCDFKLNG